MNDQIERFSDLDWQQVSEVAKQKLIDNGEKRVRLLQLQAGFQEQEWCQRGHTGFILHGTLEVEFQDDRVESYSQGDPFLLSAGEPHKARVSTGKVQLFLVDDV